MAKHHVFQNSVGDPHQHRHLSVHLSTVLIDRDFVSPFIPSFKHLLQLLELLLLLLVHQLEGPHREHRLPLNRVELQFYRGFRFRKVAHSRVMDKCFASVGMRRHSPRSHRPKRLDNSGLPSSILPQY